MYELFAGVFDLVGDTGILEKAIEQRAALRVGLLGVIVILTLPKKYSRSRNFGHAPDISPSFCLIRPTIPDSRVRATGCKGFP
jgi:hypothetical protein